MLLRSVQFYNNGAEETDGATLPATHYVKCIIGKLSNQTLPITTKASTHLPDYFTKYSPSIQLYVVHVALI